MKKVIIMICLFLPFFILKAELHYDGEPIQSGLIKIDLPDSIRTVWMDSLKLACSLNQCFLGFSRKDSLTHKIFTQSESGVIDSFSIQLKERSYNVQYINDIPEKFIEKPKSVELTERIKKEYEIITDVRKNLIYRNKNLYFKGLVAPVEGRFSSRYGDQRVLNGTPKRPHYGLDIAAPLNSPVVSCANGVVVLAGDFFYNGKFVLIDHGQGLSSIYIHLNDVFVHIGKEVLSGDEIGTVGNTGRSTGAHLHWGFYWLDVALDPELVLSYFKRENYSSLRE